MFTNKSTTDEFEIIRQHIDVTHVDLVPYLCVLWVVYILNTLIDYVRELKTNDTAPGINTDGEKFTLEMYKLFSISDNKPICATRIRGRTTLVQRIF